MKKATIILAILFSAISTHVDAQNLTKEQCLKYIMDLYSDIRSSSGGYKWTADNYRLEYDNIKYTYHNDNGTSGETIFNLSGLYIEQSKSGILYRIKNTKGEEFAMIDNEEPGQKERLEKLLKALKYLSQFATKDPFAN
jgi:hypothetical protein